MEDILYLASVWVLPVLIAITFHEAAHGWVASRLGDDTALRQGRVTFNPVAHIDPVGTIVLPGMLIAAGTGFLFGWAKPVPVNFGRLGHPRRDMVLVALAGPGINIVLAIVAALGLHLLPLAPEPAASWIGDNLINAIQINVLLAVFNMLPLPPLDGGRVAVGILPRQLALPLARTERYGLFILIGLIFILPWLGREVGRDLNIFTWLIGEPARFVIGLILQGVGLL